jgi:hypothetical protein
MMARKPDEIERIAEQLWRQREQCIKHAFGIVSTPWEKATEPGKDLMRFYARQGMTHWLGETSH